MANPKWWNDEHESTWTRVKSAMKRDWEQTKHDVSKKRGADMDQDVDDTVKQAMGKQPIPPVGARTIENDDDDDWDHMEPAYRYGVGARSHYGSQYKNWDDNLERRLRGDWDDTRSGSSWDQVKAAVRRGWERVTK